MIGRLFARRSQRATAVTSDAVVSMPSFGMSANEAAQGMKVLADAMGAGLITDKDARSNLMVDEYRAFVDVERDIYELAPVRRPPTLQSVWRCRYCRSMNAINSMSCATCGGPRR